jgi:serine/threonine protein kinase
LEAGQRIRDFILEEKIGTGGVGEVWRARHQHLDKTVALKAIYRHSSQDSHFRDRFLEEASVMARLDHPHIVSVHDFFFLDDVSYLVMAYIEGGSLEDLLKKHGRLPLDKAWQISSGILDALNFAHSRGVIHRDVKPSNVLIRANGHPYLADFGIALVVGRPRVTRLGTIIGTPEYMSPEQIQAREIDHRTDVYSFGCVLYEMLTGCPPFGSQDAGKTEYDIMNGHLHKQPPSLREINGELDGPTESVVLRALAKEPDQRYGGCQELKEDLAKLKKDFTYGKSIPDKSKRSVRKLYIIAPLAVLVVLILTVFGKNLRSYEAFYNVGNWPEWFRSAKNIGGYDKYQPYADDAKKLIGDTDSLSANSETMNRQKKVDQALIWVKTATTHGLYISDALKRVVPFRNALELAKTSGVSAETIDEMQKNLDRQVKSIEGTLNEYTQTLDHLDKLEESLKEQVFRKYLEELRKTEDADRIKKFTNTVRKHVQEYPKLKSGDFARWKTDLEQF